MTTEKSIAIEVLNLLRMADVRSGDTYLKAASIIAFPLGPIGEIQTSPRFWASFAIECLIRSICYRDDNFLRKARLAHAITVTTRWLEAES